MRKIELTKGFFTVVDDKDFEWLNQWKWCVSDNARGEKIYRVAVRSVRATKRNLRKLRLASRYKIGKTIQVRMHREVLRAPRGTSVDHINHDGLDNRRSNLRLCTQSQNSQNLIPHKDNESGFKGVAYQAHSPTKPWRAWVTINRKQTHIGYFATPQEAARAYDEVAIEHYGEFALTNKALGLID